MLRLSGGAKSNPTRHQMKAPVSEEHSIDAAYEKLTERVGYDFGLKRRAFVQILSAGLLVAANAPALAQRGGRRGGGGAKNIAARIHFGKDGSITVLVGKVEAGQGSRAELTQAAAEELRVPATRIQLVMADTSLAPDDGITAGSGTTPRTVPSVRQAATAARQLLLGFASTQWGVDASSCELREGKAIHSASNRALTYADLAANDEAAKGLQQAVASDITLTAVKEWKVMGTSVPRPNARDLVTGAHQYPSDIIRPGMLYGKILRPPAYGAKLTSIDLQPAKAMKDIIVTRSEQFVGVAAPTTFQADQALAAITKTAKWEAAAHPSSDKLYEYLRQNAEGGVPTNPFAEEVARGKQTLRESYRVAYVQHAPLEPRAAVAEWSGDGKLTVWAATQAPTRHRQELAQAFHVPEENVRVIVPDFGGGFGGKHTGETSVEAARLAQAAGQPVLLRWTREEEFTWAVFRPAALIEAEASLNENGTITSWHFININSGASAVESPYKIAKQRSQFVSSQAPLRHGSYRALASTANNFARESLMDELASVAGIDPLEFRLAHLESDRLRTVLVDAAERFNWKQRIKDKSPNIGIGLACGTEKSSYVAACAEIEIVGGQIKVRRVTQTFECGAVVNPDNLLKQVQGAIIMGLGPALSEEIRFESGELLTASFRKYKVPRFDDVPELDVHLLNRPDLESVGGGETPIIAVAPAIGNAVFRATGIRVRSMPIKLPESRKA
jgi:isoquinoline 1-oxidoreductase subunit beta